MDQIFFPLSTDVLGQHYVLKAVVRCMCLDLSGLPRYQSLLTKVNIFLV